MSAAAQPDGSATVYAARLSHRRSGDDGGLLGVANRRVPIVHGHHGEVR